MPELPEVETISHILNQGGEGIPPLPGQVVDQAVVLWERTIAMPDVARFKESIRGQKIEHLSRRGKFLIIQLTQETLLFHLRMSGDLLVERQEQAFAPHHRLVLEFTSGWRLAFNDTRKFGRVWLTADPQEVLAGLGPEPLDRGLSSAEFFRRLHSHSRQLKPLLMDQTFLAGLGNIYTDEALHLARLHPLSLSDKINEEQSSRLLASIRQVLEAGIQRNGTSIDWVYRGGDYQNYLRVYGRTGEACPVCGTPIERIVLGQRSTHYCPVCQVITA